MVTNIKLKDKCLGYAEEIDKSETDLDRESYISHMAGRRPPTQEELDEKNKEMVDKEVERQRTAAAFYKKQAELERKKEEKATAALKTALDEAGIKLSIGGCGCCSSPLVEFLIDGEKYDQDTFNFSNF